MSLQNAASRSSSKVGIALARVQPSDGANMRLSCAWLSMANTIALRYAQYIAQSGTQFLYANLNHRPVFLVAHSARASSGITRARNGE